MRKRKLEDVDMEEAATAATTTTGATSQAPSSDSFNNGISFANTNILMPPMKRAATFAPWSSTLAASGANAPPVAPSSTFASSNGSASLLMQTNTSSNSSSSSGSANSDVDNDDDHDTSMDTSSTPTSEINVTTSGAAENQLQLVLHRPPISILLPSHDRTSYDVPLSAFGFDQNHKALAAAAAASMNRRQQRRTSPLASVFPSSGASTAAGDVENDERDEQFFRDYARKRMDTEGDGGEFADNRNRHNSDDNYVDSNNDSNEEDVPRIVEITDQEEREILNEIEMRKLMRDVDRMEL
jgi:hypothetical protein